MVHQDRLHFKTPRHGHMTDITKKVEAIVAESGITTGIASLFSIGSTSALGVIEFEPGLQKDFPELLDRLMPPSRDYGHEQTWHDGNGHSHLQATLQGPSLNVPISGGKLILGTWQQIFHIECDIHARDREVVVTVMGE